MIQALYEFMLGLSPQFDVKIHTFSEKNKITQPEVLNILFSIFNKFSTGNQKRILQDLLMLFKFDEKNAVICFEKSIFFNWIVKYLFLISAYHPSNFENPVFTQESQKTLNLQNSSERQKRKDSDDKIR